MESRMPAEGSKKGSADVFGHPRGLLVLAGTEVWDRISFQGMQVLLVLYMVEQLFRPGHIEHIAGFQALRAGIECATGPLTTVGIASQIFGLYVGLAYFTPLLGGLLGDRLIGRTRTVALGCILMSAGHLLMAFEASFLLALLLLILGAGCVRGNLASQLGDLYSKTDSRRAAAFQVYYIVLNSAGFVAPLITGQLAAGGKWQYGFGFAGMGMLAGAVIYIAGRGYLPRDTSAAAVKPADRKLNCAQRRAVVCLILSLPMIAAFWIAQAQVWNTYNLWLRDHVNLLIGGWQVPVPWFQAIDALSIILLAPLVLRFWRWRAQRCGDLDELVKLGIGCCVYAVGMAWLASSDWIYGATGKVPIAWALAFHFIANVGYVYFVPVALELFSRTAPVAVNSLMMGVYYLSIFVGGTVSGRLGALYEQLPTAQFWILHAAIVAGAGLVLLLVAPFLRRGLGTAYSQNTPAHSSPAIEAGSAARTG
jgi:proton-dependent oligopeptide transporter, POT family